MMEEIWKVYKIVGGHRYCKKRIYEVSNFGNVKINGELIDLAKRKTGRYYCIANFFVHKAVAELFIPNPHNYPHVDHIDTNSHNNLFTNLRWVTQKMNCNNPLTRKHNSAAQKIAQKIVQNRPEIKQNHSENMTGKRNPSYGHTWMNNGVDRIYPLKEDSYKYLELGYHYGMWK